MQCHDLILVDFNLPVGLLIHQLIYDYVLKFNVLLILGNCCLMKPSEVSVHSATLLAKLIPKYLDQVLCLSVTSSPTPSHN